jgi:hypothetical protein
LDPVFPELHCSVCYALAYCLFLRGNSGSFAPFHYTEANSCSLESVDRHDYQIGDIRLVSNANTHTAGRTFNHFHGALNTHASQILDLDLGDFSNLSTVDFANFQ